VETAVEGEVVEEEAVVEVEVAEVSPQHSHSFLRRPSCLGHRVLTEKLLAGG
jgi:hypothetical protein